MKQNRFVKLSLTTLLLCSTSYAAHSSTLSLIRGTETHLTGSLVDIQVNYSADTPAGITGYLTSSGLVTGATPIPVERVQYDLLNNTGNDTIHSFTVNYAPGTAVVGALDPQGFYDSAGTKQTYWGGVAYMTLFDSGYGTYNYNIANGGEWSIDYQADHVTWTQVGNGFFADTATGDTNFGFNPTFSLDFAAGTTLGLMPASVTGYQVTGAPVNSSGQVLSAVPAVPVPAAIWLFGSGLFGLIGVARRRA